MSSYEEFLHRKAIVAPAWPFGSLASNRYSMIFADPPWTFQTYSSKGWGKSPQKHYSCMTLDEIKALPVQELAAADSVLMLWATAPMLPQAFEVMAAWSFEFKSFGVWHKMTRHGKTAFGTGYRLRSAAEPWLLGTIGNPRNSRSARNLFTGRVREHSRKPEEAYRWAEAYLPDVARCELFSRQRRAGWDSWGFEVDKFGSAEANIATLKIKQHDLFAEVA